ncbi:hypothetical protein [Sporosarcina sp. P26b]|nr:hypothetical protein [Sporosarcina sp. P26b]
MKRLNCSDLLSIPDHFITGLLTQKEENDFIFITRKEISNLAGLMVY